MSKIKYVKDFVRNINPEYKVKYGNIFEVDIIEEKIFITFNKHQEEDAMVQEFIEKEFGKKYNTFLIGLLHEIGHIETYDEDLDEQRDITYGLLKMAFNNGEADIKEYNNSYFYIPAEYNATRWAVEYYENHIQECETLIQNLKGANKNEI